MAVLCRQTAEGTPDQTHRIAPHRARQSDRALLRVKAESASKHGWDVEWTSQSSFVATKDRWGGVSCTRTFWIE